MPKLKKSTLIPIMASLSLKKQAKRLNVHPQWVKPVKISEISEVGFRVQTLDRDYYLTRSRYPWFADATPLELIDCGLIYDATIRWVTLDVDWELSVLDHPEKSKIFGCYVRNKNRPDLFEGFIERYPQFEPR